MSDDPESNAAGKARAAALHAEIDRLTGKAKPAVDGAKVDEAADQKPTNPRDYINQWMAEHDKKPES
jgi:hypothetical protein